MIKYKNSPVHFILRVCQRTGSVFPVSTAVAGPCALLAAILKLLTQLESTRGSFGFLADKTSIMLDSTAWNGFSVLVGFLIVFRTSQAYNRFWEGCTAVHRMRVEWFNFCSQINSFCGFSKLDRRRVEDFQVLLTNLFSILDAVALGDISDTAASGSNDVPAFTFDLLGVVDQESLLAIKRSDSKTELVFQWIQTLVMQNLDNGVVAVAPPLVAGALQRGAIGLSAFHDAIRISTVPFPFPYAQICDCLLMLHWMIVPFTVCTFTREPWWAAIFTFVQVFVLWSLNFIAAEIENPFGMDANDLDVCYMHTEANQHLCVLLSDEGQRVPQLPSGKMGVVLSTTLEDAWAAIDGPSMRATCRRGSNSGHHQVARRSCKQVPKPEEHPVMGGPLTAHHGQQLADAARTDQRTLKFCEDQQDALGSVADDQSTHSEDRRGQRSPDELSDQSDCSIALGGKEHVRRGQVARSRNQQGKNTKSKADEIPTTTGMVMATDGRWVWRAVAGFMRTRVRAKKEAAAAAAAAAGLATALHPDPEQGLGQELPATGRAVAAGDAVVDRAGHATQARAVNPEPPSPRSPRLPDARGQAAMQDLPPNPPRPHSPERPEGPSWFVGQTGASSPPHVPPARQVRGLWSNI